MSLLPAVVFMGWPHLRVSHLLDPLSLVSLIGEVAFLALIISYKVAIVWIGELILT